MTRGRSEGSAAITVEASVLGSLKPKAPLMLRLNLECPTAAGVQEKLKELKKFLGEPVEGH